MNEQDVNKAIARVEEFRASTGIKTPEEWTGMGTDLQILLYRLNTERLAKEIIAKKKKFALRPSYKSDLDTTTEWETTQEWAEWQHAELQYKEMKSFKSSAYSEASIRKENSF
jgi:hypothetical protein